MKKEIYWRCKETLRFRDQDQHSDKPLEICFVQGKKYQQKGEYKGSEYLELIDESGVSHTVTSGGMGWLQHFSKVEDETTEENNNTD